MGLGVEYGSRRHGRGGSLPYYPYDHQYDSSSSHADLHDSYRNVLFKAGAAAPVRSPSLGFSSCPPSPSLASSHSCLCSPKSATWSHVGLHHTSASHSLASPSSHSTSLSGRKSESKDSSVSWASSSSCGASTLKSCSRYGSRGSRNSRGEGEGEDGHRGPRVFPFEEYPPLVFSPSPSPSISARPAQIEIDKQLLQTKMMTALKERRTEQAWEAWQSMKKIGMLPSGTSLSALLIQLSHNHGAPRGVPRAHTILDELHGQRRCNLLSADALRCLAMASTRAGEARYALSVLRTMSEMGLFPSVKLWSAVVSRLGRRRDDCALALELFSQICVFLLESKGKKGFVNKPQKDGLLSMSPDTSAFNAALYACATLKDAKEANRVWGMMSEFAANPNTITFNILIKVYACTGQKDLLKGVLPQMEKARVEPDQCTLNSLISAHVGLHDVQAAENLLECLQDRKERGKNGYKKIRFALDNNGEEVYLALKCKNLKSWETRLHNKATKGGRDAEDAGARWGLRLRPDARTYTTLLEGYAQAGRIGDALELLWAMQQQKDDARVFPDTVTYTVAIAACVKLSLMEEACRILQAMAAALKAPATVFPYNALLQGYCRSHKATDLKKAHQFFSYIAGSGVAMDVVTYNTMLRGCMKAGDYEGGLKLFRQMGEKGGTAPSELTYRLLLEEFGRSGQPTFAFEVFKDMQKDPRMDMRIGEWNALIESFCQARRMADAKEMFRRMKESRLRPTVVTYTMLVKGFARAGVLGEALALWKEIKDCTEAKTETGGEGDALKPNGELLETLLETCVRAGYFQRALEVVSYMEDGGIVTNKMKYKQMFNDLFFNLCTRQHPLQRRGGFKDGVEAFKCWVGLPVK